MSVGPPYCSQRAVFASPLGAFSLMSVLVGYTTVYRLRADYIVEFLTHFLLYMFHESPEIIPVICSRAFEVQFWGK